MSIDRHGRVRDVTGTGMLPCCCMAPFVGMPVERRSADRVPLCIVQNVPSSARLATGFFR